MDYRSATIATGLPMLRFLGGLLFGVMIGFFLEARFGQQLAELGQLLWLSSLVSIL
jgi:hypothetical protein